jgi:hypothetical protein
MGYTVRNLMFGSMGGRTSQNGVARGAVTPAADPA